MLYGAVAGSGGSPGSEIRFGAAANGAITTPADSHLADILKGGLGWTLDGTHCDILGDDDNFVVVDHWTITKSTS